MNNKLFTAITVVIMFGLLVFIVVSFERANNNDDTDSSKESEIEELSNILSEDLEFDQNKSEDEKESNDNTGSENPDNQVTGNLKEPLKKVKYSIEFRASWSKETHPEAYVTSAHFSPFVAYAYADKDPVFKLTQKATPGIEEMAETGATTLLETELNNHISKNSLYVFTKGKRIDSPGSDKGSIELTQEFSKIGFLSMIAPSPDWFVTIPETDMFVDGQWLDSYIISLISLDSGTDSGQDLTSADQETSPQANITQADIKYQEMGTLVLKLEE